MSEDRIAKLSERFNRHRPEEPRTAAPSRVRERRSLYLDGSLLERIDREHRALNHRIYPGSVSKAEFLESLIEQGLAAIEQIEHKLARSAQRHTDG